MPRQWRIDAAYKSLQTAAMPQYRGNARRRSCLARGQQLREDPTPMRYAIFPVLVIVASFAASVAVEAREWKRQGSVTTQKGTYTTQGSGACAG